MKMEFAIPIERFRVPPESAVNLAEHDTAWAGTPEMLELGKKALKKRAKTFLENNVAGLAMAQELLYADDRHAVLIVFQAMDAAGKDGTIKHVMSGVNPQGCQVFSFKAPSKEELDHDFLWRCAKSLPERGRIGIFNRSYYEEVLVVRALVSHIITTGIHALDLSTPKQDEARRAALSRARKALEKEKG
jgi:polyphosphate kinase 2 (PPK2 family)